MADPPWRYTECPLAAVMPSCLTRSAAKLDNIWFLSGCELAWRAHKLCLWGGSVVYECEPTHVSRHLRCRPLLAVFGLLSGTCGSLVFVVLALALGGLE